MSARVAIAALLLLLACPTGPHAQVRLRSESDRLAFRAWFLLLTDAQFYRTTADVDDCAALVRHAVREALRPHGPEWLRLARLPLARVPPELADRPAAHGAAMPLFLVERRPDRYAEFADARTIIELNTRPIARDLAAARPGDLLYFRQPHQRLPDHLMVLVGESALAPEASDWVVYHTGPGRATAREASVAAAPPSAGVAAAPGPEGEVRKVRLADLLRHPDPRWRPMSSNPSFVGVFRLRLLS